MAAKTFDFYAFTASYFRKKREDIRAETSFRRDLKADAFDLFCFILEIEAACDLFLDDRSTERIVNVGQLEYLLNAARNEKSAEEKGTNHGEDLP